MRKSSQHLEDGERPSACAATAAAQQEPASERARGPSGAAHVEMPPTRIVLVECRSLMRDCLVGGLSSETLKVLPFPSIEEWIAVSNKTPASLILLSVSASTLERTLQEQMPRLTEAANRLPVVLLCDSEDPDQIVAALEHGVRGYIPTSVSIDVAVEALWLVRVGGTYIPASSLIAARRMVSAPAGIKQIGSGIFTARQAAVVDALRRGKANKIIAYELNMRESTVKVHVRSIMKKLKAKNRTEVAFLANNLVRSEGTGSS